MQKSTKQILLALLSAIIAYLICANYFAHNAALTISAALLMVILWATEAIDLPVTGMLPLLLFPIFGLQTIEKTASCYSSPVIYLFLSGFVIGTAIEKSNLHRRLALFLISTIGTSGNKILLSFIICTGFISMWISNTATTLMMLPLALSIIAIFSSHKEGNFENFQTSLLLSVAYASNFGGIATLIGSPPNMIMANFIEKTYHTDITFLSWLKFGLPISICLLTMLFLTFIAILPNHLKEDKTLTANIADKRKSLGKITDVEFKTLIIFLTVVFFWILGPLLQNLLPIKINDTSTAVAGAVSFFIVRSNGKTILNWKDTKEIPWGILLLFGGGLALASALEENKVLNIISDYASALSSFSFAFIIIVTIFVSLFASELLNNISQVIIFLPIICGLASSLKYDPIVFAYALTIAAGSASMFPTGTPPNAIVFASEKIEMQTMIKTGLILNILSSIIISIVFLFV